MRPEPPRVLRLQMFEPGPWRKLWRNRSCWLRLKRHDKQATTRWYESRIGGWRNLHTCSRCRWHGWLV